MIEDRFVIERTSSERQTELLREMKEAMGKQNDATSARAITLRARTIRLVGVAALALALLGGGLLSAAGEVAADSAGGGASVAEGIGYVP